MNEELKYLLEKALEKYIVNNPYSLEKDEHGYYYYEHYADRYDGLYKDNIEKIVNDTEDPETVLETIVEDIYWENEDEIYEEILTELEKNIKYFADDTSLYKRGLLDNEKEEIKEYLQDNVYFKYPYEHYLKQEICADIIIDTGDGNYDYTLNCIQPAYGGIEINEIDEKASIVWLTKQQGYTLEDLKEKLKDKTESPYECTNYMDSVKYEIINETGSINVLTVLVRITIGEIIKIKELLKNKETNNAELIIDKRANIGLIDFFNGGGSGIDIVLEKDLVIPLKYIHDIVVDYAKETSFGYNTYSIHDIYGVDNSLWKNTLKEIKGE